MSDLILAIDQGTTGTTAVLLNARAAGSDKKVTLDLRDVEVDISVE